jgi:hypothetical protein
VKSAHIALMLGSACVTIWGIAVSAWGTYLMTFSLHPFDWDGFRDFIFDSPRFAMALLEEQRMKTSDLSRGAARTLKDLETLSKLAAVNQNGETSLSWESGCSLWGSFYRPLE